MKRWRALWSKAENRRGVIILAGLAALAAALVLMSGPSLPAPLPAVIFVWEDWGDNLDYGPGYLPNQMMMSP